MKTKLLMLFVLFTTGAYAQSADEIVQKYFANSGGIEKRKAITTKTSAGQMMMSMHGAGGPLSSVDITIYEKYPSMQKVVTKLPTVEIIQSFDGKDAWMYNPMMGGKDPVLMDDSQSKQLRNYEFESSLLDYKNKGHEVTYLGTEEVDGVTCYKIQLIKNKHNDKEDITEIYYFESENHLPFMVVTYLLAGPNKGQESRTFFDDYRNVNGVLFPFTRETKVKGQTIQKMTFQRIVTNEPIENAIFSLPKK